MKAANTIMLYPIRFIGLLTLLWVTIGNYTTDQANDSERPEAGIFMTIR